MVGGSIDLEVRQNHDSSQCEASDPYSVPLTLRLSKYCIGSGLGSVKCSTRTFVVLGGEKPELMTRQCNRKYLDKFHPNNMDPMRRQGTVNMNNGGRGLDRIQDRKVTSV